MGICWILDSFPVPLMFLFYQKKVTNIDKKTRMSLHTLTDSIFFSKFYEIKKRPQNIIGLRMQTIFGISLMANVLVFHLVKIFILQSDNSFSETTFTLWIQGMILDNLGRYKIYRETFTVIACLCAVSRLVWNAVIYWSAVRRLPEFSGHSGRRYPGQQPPRPLEVEPRRMRLPSTFSQVGNTHTVGVIRNETLVFVNFSAQDASILKISVPIIKRRSRGFQNTPNL